MKFLVDECVGPSVARWLKQNGYDVVSVYDEFPGIDDNEVLGKAFSEDRVLITSDKDFGEMVFKDQQRHVGILILRLLNQHPSKKIEILEIILKKHKNDLRLNFVVVTELNIRIIKPFSS